MKKFKGSKNSHFGRFSVASAPCQRCRESAFAPLASKQREEAPQVNPHEHHVVVMMNLVPQSHCKPPVLLVVHSLTDGSGNCLGASLNW